MAYLISNYFDVHFQVFWWALGVPVFWRWRDWLPLAKFFRLRNAEVPRELRFHEYLRRYRIQKFKNGTTVAYTWVYPTTRIKDSIKPKQEWYEYRERKSITWQNDHNDLFFPVWSQSVWTRRKEKDDGFRAAQQKVNLDEANPDKSNCCGPKSNHLICSDKLHVVFYFFSIFCFTTKDVSDSSPE